MNRRTFVAAIGAVCAFPTALFAKSKPIHRFHKGSISGTYKMEDLLQPSDLLTETKLNHCLALWDKHRIKRPTIVLLSVRNLLNLMEEADGSSGLEGIVFTSPDRKTGHGRYGWKGKTTADGRRLRGSVILQSDDDLCADHFIIIGRSEHDEDAMPIFFRHEPLFALPNPAQYHREWLKGTKFDADFV